MAPKKFGEKMAGYSTRYRPKNSLKSLYLTPFQDKCTFAEFQDGCQKMNVFWHKEASDSAYTLQPKYFVEITLALFLKEMRFFASYTECPDGHHKWRESNFGKKWHVNLGIPCGPKISSKSLDFAPFPKLMCFCIYTEIQDGRQK